MNHWEADRYHISASCLKVISDFISTSHALVTQSIRFTTKELFTCQENNKVDLALP